MSEVDTTSQVLYLHGLDGRDSGKQHIPKQHTSIRGSLCEHTFVGTCASIHVDKCEHTFVGTCASIHVDKCIHERVRASHVRYICLFMYSPNSACSLGL